MKIKIKACESLIKRMKGVKARNKDAGRGRVFLSPVRVRKGGAGADTVLSAGGGSCVGHSLPAMTQRMTYVHGG